MPVTLERSQVSSASTSAALRPLHSTTLVCTASDGLHNAGLQNVACRQLQVVP